MKINCLNLLYVIFYNFFLHNIVVRVELWSKSRDLDKSQYTCIFAKYDINMIRSKMHIFPYLKKICNNDKFSFLSHFFVINLNLKLHIILAIPLHSNNFNSDRCGLGKRGYVQTDSIKVRFSLL